MLDKNVRDLHASHVSTCFQLPSHTGTPRGRIADLGQSYAVYRVFDLDAIQLNNEKRYQVTRAWPGCDGQWPASLSWRLSKGRSSGRIE